MEFTPLNTFIEIDENTRYMLFAGIALSAALLVPKIRPRVGWLPALLWAYVVGFAIFYLEYPSYHWGGYVHTFEGAAGQVLAEVLFLPLLFIFVEFDFFRCLPWIVLVEVVCLWFKLPGLTDFEVKGPSFATSLIALCLPFVPTWAFIIGLGTVVCFHGSTAFMILGAEFLALCVHHKKLRNWSLLVAPILAILVWVHDNGQLLSGTGRVVAWKHFMVDFWATDWHPVVFGAGPGAFIWASVLIDKLKPPVWMQLHNDWLQIAFDYGSIGLGLAIGAYATAIKRAWRNPFLLAGVFGVGAFGLTYFPLHKMVTMFVVAMILGKALIIKEKGPEPKPEAFRFPWPRKAQK